MLFSSDESEHLEVRMRVRMELFARIRRDARVEGLSIRGLAKRYQIAGTQFGRHCRILSRCHEDAPATGSG